MRLLALLLALPLLAALAYAGWRVSALWAPAPALASASAGPAGAPCRLLLAGDSLITRWPRTAPPPGWQVQRLGRAGATATSLAAPISAAIARSRPDLLVLHAGGNDAAGIAFLWGPPRRAAIARSAAAIAAMASAGRRAGARVILLTPLPPADQPWWRALLIGQRQARAMAELAAATPLPPGAIRLDPAPLLPGPGWRADHLHLNAAGYARIEAALAPYLGCATAAS